MRSIFAFATAALAAVTSAYTKPVGDPSGNPIYKPGLDEIVPVGKPYTITWDPTTQGTVTLVLLRGPSENVQPLYPIVEKIPNSGTYQWTPSADLEPDTTHYGIQLIVDSTGQYQYTTQFGISNPGYNGGSSSTATSHATSHGSYVTSSGSYASSSTSCSTSTSCTTSSTIAPSGYNSTITAYPTHGTGVSSYPPHNSTIVKPTGSLTVPSSLKTTTKQPTGYTTVAPVPSTPAATTSAPPQATGAAGKLSIGLGAIMGAIVLAL